MARKVVLVVNVEVRVLVDAIQRGNGWGPPGEAGQDCCHSERRDRQGGEALGRKDEKSKQSTLRIEIAIVVSESMRCLGRNTATQWRDS